MVYQFEAFLQTLINATLLGGVYALLCVGLALIFSVMYIVNFAQGEFMMLGMYAAAFAVAVFSGSSTGVGVLGILGSSALSGVTLFIVGVLIYSILLRPIIATTKSSVRVDGHYVQLTLTLGLSLILSNGALILFGSHPTIVKTPLSNSSWIMNLGPMSIFVNQMRSLTFIVACIIGIVLVSVMTKSRLGRDLIATADNAEASTYMGINNNVSYVIAFGMGAAITGLGGALIAANNPFQPYIGLEYVVIMYTGVVMGGMKSIKGAWIGGMVVAYVQEFTGLLLSVELQGASIFVVFLLLLLFKPNGFFGQIVERA
ncbi:MAG: branched-chain amino acid ABC transporter permease [Candidatus Cloacimonetes bacterium]|nr:branched-chain amino acid ABC transporter permease [Candidatus Cloacimonadota bacterium]